MTSFAKAACTALVISLAGSGAALAATVAGDTVTGTWTSVETPDTARLNGVGTSQIRWGVGFRGGPQSGYGFAGEDLSGPTPLDTVFKIGTFTHSNRPILTLPTGKSSIKGASLTVSIALNIGGSVTRTLTSVFDFEHWETNNNPGPGQACANGAPNRTGLNVGGCADRVIATRNDGQSDSVQIGNLIYELDITGFLFNGQALTEFWTVEGRENSAILQGVVRTRDVGEPPPPPPAPIPLPAAGWLMIAGLGGLAAAARRRRH